MTAGDKPRADLVALFDAFAALPAGHATLSLFGDEPGEVLEGWAAVAGHLVQRDQMYTALSGHWTLLSVRVAGGTISVHLETVRTAQADQAVLARVKAALDGERPESPACPECDGPADHCPGCGATATRPCVPGCSRRYIKQPEAAEGSV